MNFVNIPITDYYRRCLNAAKSAGFKWVVSLVAYDAERDGLYRNLHRAWLSLDCITGKHILFVVAGKENRTHEERWNSKILDTFESSGVYNDYVSFLNEDTKLTDYLRYSIKDERERTYDRIRRNQTRAVEELKEYFGIQESEIPCLIFVSLRSNEKHIVPICRRANDIFDYFKNIFVKIEPRLKVVADLENEFTTLSGRQKNIASEIKEITFSGVEIIYKLYEELMQQANENNNSELLQCVQNMTYGKFEQPLRSQLNKFVDLIKNYEKNYDKPFDSNSAADSCQNKIRKKITLENKLAGVSSEIERVETLRGHYLDEIDEIIRSSEMSEKTRDNNRLSVTVTGGNPQINAAFDEAAITATQNNGVDIDKLHRMLEDVRKTISANMSLEDINAVNENLEVIESESKHSKPRKSFLKTALTGLQAIKGTAEFGAAVTVLVQFVSALI